MKNIRNSLLRHLLQPGIHPKQFSPELLLYWIARPRNPVLACNDNLAKMFIQAMLTGDRFILSTSADRSQVPREV